MGDRSELGAHAVCCLLHNLIPGGSAWQWIRLLSRHVERGGRATIFAPPGPLATPARATGIEVVETPPWMEGGVAGLDSGLWDAVATHQAAIVHWEQGVTEAFAPVLEACGRAALAMHQSPRELVRWFGPPTVERARETLELAAADPRAVALVRGETHRRQIASAFDLSSGDLRVLPVAVPLPSLAFRPVQGEPREVLALTRLSPEKAAIVRLAVELVGERLARGQRCNLTIAGTGPWNPEAVTLCERRLPVDSWRIEGAPRDALAKLASADVVVAQGGTTLEAAALGRRVVVARPAGEDGAAGAVLTPARYGEAAADPFGEPPLTADPALIWDEVLSLSEGDLRELRRLVEIGNSPTAASRALGDALAATTSPLGRVRARLPL
jgi:hypothetical protein